MRSAASSESLARVTDDPLTVERNVGRPGIPTRAGRLRPRSPVQGGSSPTAPPARLRRRGWRARRRRPWTALRSRTRRRAARRSPAARCRPVLTRSPNGTVVPGPPDAPVPSKRMTPSQRKLRSDPPRGARQRAGASAHRPPLIGVTGRRWPGSVLGTRVAKAMHDAEVDLHFADYSIGIAAAGGMPVGLSRDAPVEPMLERIDGLVLSGGADVDPGRYGHEREPALGTVEESRDAWELALLAAALDRSVPVFG